MASDLTPLRKRPYPAETDTPDVAADVQSLALSLDNCPNVHQGTLANRPTTGMVGGDRYYVTGDPTSSNNGVDWIYDGNLAQWVQSTKLSFIGAGALWFGPNDPSAQWMICDGRAISRTTYSTLFNVIGTTYGSGDGSTTFNIPDLRQRVPLGKKSTSQSGSGANLGEKGGQIDHVHLVSGLSIPSLSIPSLSCSVTVPAHSHPLSGNGGALVSFADNGSSYLAIFAAPTGRNFTYSGWHQYGSTVEGWQATAEAEPTAALEGTTDNCGALGAGGSTASGSTGTGTTGAAFTSANNMPYLTINFVICVT